MIELGAVGLKTGLQVEDSLEYVLNVGDVVADGRLAAKGLLEVGRRAQVIGVGVGFQDPGHVQAVGIDVGDDPVGRVGPGAARLGVVVQHGVNDGACRPWPLVDHVGHRPGGLVKNAVHVRLGERLGRRLGHRLGHRGFLIGPLNGLLIN